MRRPFANTQPPIKYTNTGIRMPVELMRKLEEVARKERVSRNVAIAELLDWAIEAYAEMPKK